MREHVAADSLRRRAAPGRSDRRRLRAGVFRLGGLLGLDTRAVVRFSEVISGRRWRRCGSGDLEQVATDFVALAIWSSPQLVDQRVDSGRSVRPSAGATLMPRVRFRRNRRAGRLPAEQLLEVVTPRTNTALINPAEHLCAGLCLHTGASGNEPVALEIVADAECCPVRRPRAVGVPSASVARSAWCGVSAGSSARPGPPEPVIRGPASRQARRAGRVPRHGPAHR